MIARFSLRRLSVLLAVLCFAVAWSFAAAQNPVGTPKLDENPVKPPRGVKVLFDGKNTEAWVQRSDGSSCKWEPQPDGSLLVNPKASDILTREKFGDFQLHVEFNLPVLPESVSSQERGNSGVYLHGLYEVQVLDSFNNTTYANGMCGAIYELKPPDINACKPAGTWQTYDITFRAPRLNGDKVAENPRVTVYHNGIRIHDNVEITGGPTRASLGGPMTATGPILLQNHSNPVRYRNIWIKPLKLK